LKAILGNIRKDFLGGTKPLMLSVLLLVSVGCAFLFAAGLNKIPLFIIGGLIGIIILYYCLVHPYIGFFIVTTISYFTAFPDRLLRIEIPISTGIEVLMLALFIGSHLFARKKIDQGNFYKSGISFAFFLYLLFTFIELFNPNMYSSAGWFFFLRRFIMFMLIYHVAYRLFDTPDKLKLFFKYWIFLAFITAAYACFQQWFGLLPFEMNYLMSNPHEYKLYFQGGTIRKFSFVSDPTTLGILEGSSAAFLLIFLINEKNSKRRALLFFVFFVLILGMTFSGTRTSNIMLPAALCLYVLITITNKTTLVTVFVFFLAAAFILFGPVQNASINRIRSTFDKKEESGAVRDMNRKYIQPYIYSHPIGGGISTSGVLGEKYNPGHPLAGFPPDSGLLLAAIELGWVGYALTILVYILILYQCIHYYFVTNNEKHKVYIAAITVSIFSIIITQYSQVTIGQLPTALFFYAALAMTTRLKELGTVA
jgi:putative inorganic carbon (hco3(-)) transporter